ncbi:two-component system histidine kinase PnpS [Priestia megaterium]|uniref:two-component system histidine kinase PnpS n=1 Tax=Priestia megaterium TaxID=1404 RepID=UPI0034D4F9BC
MNKFRSRLLLALLVLIIIVLVGLGLLLGQLFKNFYFQTFQERMEKEAKLVEMYISEEGITSPALKSKVDQISHSLSVRTTIVQKDGKILVDSNPGSKQQRIEKSIVIQQVLKKQLNSKKSFDQIKEDYDLYYYGIPLIIEGKQEGFVVLSTSFDSLKQVNQQIWGLLIGSLGLALIVILLLGVKIMGRYTRPIESATKVAMELAKGNYKARTYEDYVDETGMLSQSINALARNLQESITNQEMQQDRLRTLIENMGSGMLLIDSRGYINLVNRAYKEQFHIHPDDFLYHLYYEVFEYREIIKLVEKIFMTEVKVRKQVVLPLNIERRYFDVYGAPIIGLNDEWKGIVLVFHDITELKKLEQVRRDFVANVSHELKTPITSIKGFSETLLDGAMEDPQLRQQFLSIILTESQRMESLIQDLLDLSKVEQQGFKLSIHSVDLNTLLYEVTTVLSNRATEKEITLTLDTLPEEAWIDGDSQRLMQVFVNLIGNALMYTMPGGTVHVSLEEEEETITVHVQDTGIGIDSDEISRIFERFYRVDKARSRNSGGTGLGLAIVKHLVEAHKGEIEVKSEVNKGTTFSVKLHKYLPQM